MRAWLEAWRPAKPRAIGVAKRPQTPARWAGWYGRMRKPMDPRAMELKPAIPAGPQTAGLRTGV